jgi:hypothetical protein
MNANSFTWVISLLLASSCGSGSTPSMNADSMRVEPDVGIPPRDNLGGEQEQDARGHDANDDSNSECGDCSSGSICVDGQACQPVVCATSLDCPVDSVCHPVLGICVACVTSSDCGPGTTCGPDSECHVFGGSCVSDKDCQAVDMLCDFEQGICVECLNSAACPNDHYCLERYCVPDICSPGDSHCQGQVVMTCSESGSSWNELLCAPEEYCKEGTCYPFICQPHAKWCEESSFMECSGDGRFVLSEQDCATLDMYCTSAGCQDKPCESGQVWCLDMHTAASCSTDGLQRSMPVRPT